MEYELEERPRQMGDDWNDEWPISWVRPAFSPPASRLPYGASNDCAMIIPEQEPIC